MSHFHQWHRELRRFWLVENKRKIMYQRTAREYSWTAQCRVKVKEIEEKDRRGKKVRKIKKIVCITTCQRLTSVLLVCNDGRSHAAVTFKSHSGMSGTSTSAHTLQRVYAC